MKQKIDEFKKRWKPKAGLKYDSVEAGRYSEQFKSDLNALLRDVATDFLVDYAEHFVQNFHSKEKAIIYYNYWLSEKEEK